jgi:hypothetical protein
VSSGYIKTSVTNVNNVVSSSKSNSSKSDQMQCRAWNPDSPAKNLLTMFTRQYKINIRYLDRDKIRPATPYGRPR